MNYKKRGTHACIGAFLMSRLLGKWLVGVRLGAEDVAVMRLEEGEHQL